MDQTHQKQVQSAKYEERIVAFIDVLGFREALISSATDPKRVRELCEMFLWIREQMGIDLPDWVPEMFDDDRVSTQFSDCVVITCRVDKMAIWDILARIRIAQIDALGYKILLRGAVTKGLIYHTPERDGRRSLVFGPGLVAAYEMENEIAVMPRVIVEKSVAELAHPINREADQLLSQDKDSLWYVNYLTRTRELEQGIGMAFNSKGHHYYDFDEYVTQVHHVIADGLTSEKAKIRRKYRWMQAKLVASDKGRGFKSRTGKSRLH